MHAAALTHASAHVTPPQVQLTWDETDHERVAAMSRTFDRDELLDMDFRAYLASSSEEEPEEEEEERRGEPSGRRGNGLLTAPLSAAGGGGAEKRSEEQLCKYRELLRGLQEEERRQQEDRDVDMEVTWVPGKSSPGPRPRPPAHSVTSSRTEGDHGAAGEEEAGAAGAADALGGVPAEEEGEEEAEEEPEEAGEEVGGRGWPPLLFLPHL